MLYLFYQKRRVILMRKLCAMFIIFALTLTAVVSCGEKAERVENVFRSEEIKLPDGFSPAGLAF